MDTFYTLLPLILIILIMYFLLIRPQKKREKQVNAMRSRIKAGDEIVTIGGIYGVIVKAKEDKLILQVGADKTRLEIARWAVSKLTSEEDIPPRPKKAQENDEDKTPPKSRPRRLEKTPSKEKDIVNEAKVNETAASAAGSSENSKEEE